MKIMKTVYSTLTAVLFAGLLSAGYCLAQEAAETPDIPVVDIDAPEKSDMERIEIDPKELERLIKESVQSRLKIELDQAAGEIELGILYDPDVVDPAIEEMLSNPAGTAADNVQRIYNAFAAVDDRFNKPYKLFKDGKFAASAEAMAKIKNPEEVTYLGAAKYLLYADALRKSGKEWDAIDAYGDLCQFMPDRVSFAAQAAAKSAEIFEGMGRYIYAMEMYAFCLENYGLTMDHERSKKMADRLAELKEKYDDPMKTITTLMGKVEDKFEKAAKDAPKDSQLVKQQEEIAKMLADASDEQAETISLLEDIIKTHEEKKKQQQSSKQKQDERQKRSGSKKKCDGEKKDGEGKNPGKSKGKPGPPKGMQSSNPAKTSALVPGPVKRPDKLSNEHTSADDGNWSKLAPDERSRIENVKKKVASEKHGDAIRDYHRRLAEIESESKP